jgi:16S rRNA C1402 N4-methylase RsmH
MQEGHMPVLVEEVLMMLAPAPGSLQIDATLGGGGHTERILEATEPDGRLLGLDADEAAIARVAGRLQSRFGNRLVLRRANFRELRTVAPDAGERNDDAAGGQNHRLIHGVAQNLPVIGHHRVAQYDLRHRPPRLGYAQVLARNGEP